MATCDTQQLITDAECLKCLTPGEQQLARLALLVRILKANDPSYVLNVQQLATDAQCFNCLLSYPGMIPIARLSLWCRIKEAMSS
jgi:hypothetical protein